MMSMRINIGCGQTPTEGWANFDASPSVKLAQRPAIASALGRFGLLHQSQVDNISFCQKHEIRFADATRRIPVPDETADALYSSHMLEHLDRREARQFLAEARRVLKPGGVIRLAVPDVRLVAEAYVREGDANQFIEATLLYRDRPRSFRERVQYHLVGDRGHKWMYDGTSLVNLLMQNGFSAARVMKAGETMIADPGQLNLREREGESVYVEALKPGRS